jgi:hypothetical protein
MKMILLLIGMAIGCLLAISAIIAACCCWRRENQRRSGSMAELKPPKFMRIQKKLHTAVKVHCNVNGVSRVVDSTIDVKQGDLLGPDLFNIHICAIMIIWRTKYTGLDCVF